jgi:hypothetical protein
MNTHCSVSLLQKKMKISIAYSYLYPDILLMASIAHNPTSFPFTRLPLELQVMIMHHATKTVVVEDRFNNKSLRRNVKYRYKLIWLRPWSVNKRIWNHRPAGWGVRLYMAASCSSWEHDEAQYQMDQTVFNSPTELVMLPDVCDEERIVVDQTDYHGPKVVWVAIPFDWNIGSHLIGKTTKGWNFPTTTTHISYRWLTSWTNRWNRSTAEAYSVDVEDFSIHLFTTRPRCKHLQPDMNPNSFLDRCETCFYEFLHNPCKKIEYDNPTTIYETWEGEAQDYDTDDEYSEDASDIDPSITIIECENQRKKRQILGK